MITKETAADIWHAYNETEKAEELLKHCAEQLERTGTLDCLKDSRGNGLTLGIPSGPGSHSLYHVDPVIAVRLIQSHIDLKQIRLKELMAIAQLQLKG